jgi:UDP-N-acetyl-D-galactosamine dehydrogenase
LVDKTATNYDAVVVAVNHREYQNFDENYFNSISSNNGIVVDLKGIYRGKINKMTYWSL